MCNSNDCQSYTAGVPITLCTALTTPQALGAVAGFQAATEIPVSQYVPLDRVLYFIFWEGHIRMQLCLVQRAIHFEL